MQPISEIVITDGLSLRVVPGKGRGVFAARAFRKLDVIGVNPVLVFDETASRAVEATPMSSYIFAWPFGPDGAVLEGHSPYVAVAFGLLSLINNTAEEGANAAWDYNAEAMVIIGYAVRDIEIGEEIEWSYNWAAA